MKGVLAAIATVCIAIMPALAHQAESGYTMGRAHLILQSRSDGAPQGIFATFAGRVRLAGKLIIEFDRLPNQVDLKDTEGEAFFEPDSRSRELLPRAVGTFYPKTVNSIALDKRPQKLLRSLMGIQQVEEILRGSMPRYEIPAILTIKSFSSWVECDHRSYTAEVESIAPSKGRTVAAAQPMLIGC